jgi:tetratricopeptide (TPR) repeat protein
MADADAAMSLALADGRVQLTIENRDLGAAVIEHLSVDWPGVSTLPEAGRPNGLRRRRGRLRTANLLVDGKRLQSIAQGIALPEGLTRIRLVFEKGRIVVAGAVSAAGRDADFKARIRLTAGVGRRLRVNIEDIRVQDVPPLPLSAIGAAVLKAFGSQIHGDAQPSEDALDIDVLRPALDELLVAEGWRLPDSAHVRLASAVVSLRGLELAWQEEDPRAAAQPAGVERTSQGYEPPVAALRRSVDEAPRGPERAVVAHQLAAACERANDEAGAVAALRICVENAGTGPLVGMAWRRLVELYARRGDPHAAARALISSADDPRTAASDPERAAALIAAAEILRKRLALPGDAGMLLERAIALDPTSIEALEALDSLTTETGNFERLADVLERKLVVAARGPVEQQEILAQLVQIYDGPVSRPDRARLLRDRMALIDLETTPMIPIAPPDTRVAVPPIPEADVPAGAALLEDSTSPRDELSEEGTEADGVAAAPPPIEPALVEKTAVDAVPPDAEPAPEPPLPATEANEQAAVHAAAGKTAEAGGDLERAEQAYWRAASIEAQPALRANYLVAHARVLLARGDVETARGQLESARETAPGHVGATALLADVSYRTQDWRRARDLYARLDAAPAVTDVLPREVLVQRRAALADRLGDVDEAEALYRELAILNPQHVGARKALSELARARGELPDAVLRLEEVLRLMPSDTSGELLDIRQRLAAMYAELGEWESVRHYLELVLTQDPSRAPALEMLLEAYDHLQMPAEAAKVCARLARLYFEPSRRAAALYRQAEILREQLGNPAAALDAYLRSSDVDPRFVPSRLRLVDHFWNVGDLDVVAELANDLNTVPLSADSEPDLIVRLAIASTTLRGGATSRFPFTPALGDAAGRAIVDAAAHQELLEGRPIEALDPMLTRARIWSGEGEQALYDTLIRLTHEDPGRPGAASALARFAETGGRLALANAAYGLAAFVLPGCPAARHIPALPSPGHVVPEAVAIGGPADHPSFAVPARRALARLASALLGYGTDAPAPKPTEGSGLPPTRATELRRIGDLLEAPPFIVVRDSGEPKPGEERRRLRVIPTQPAGLLIAAAAAALTDKAWAFVAGRALETLRSGLRTSGLAGGDGLARMLEGARAVLADAPIDEPQARAVAEWLRTPGAALLLGSPETRAAALVDVEAALAALPDWPSFVRGAQHTRNRIGLLACTSPADALGVLKIEERGVPGRPDTDTPEGRQAFLRTTVANELIGFMLSPAYEAAFAPDPEEPS